MLKVFSSSLLGASFGENLEKRLFSSTGLFMDWKLQTDNTNLKKSNTKSKKIILSLKKNDTKSQKIILS